MPQSDDCITLATQDGEVFSCWESVTIRDAFDDPLGNYEFTVVPNDSEWASNKQKLRKGELVAIKVGTEPLATPIITSQEIILGKNERKLKVTCKSVLCTAYEGSSNPDLAKKWKEDVTVETALLDQLTQYGFSAFIADAWVAHMTAVTGKQRGNSKSPVKVKSLTLKELQGQDAETCYQLCSRVFMRLGCALHVDWQGELMLCQPDYDQDSLYSLVQDSDFSHAGDRLLDDPPIVVHDSNDGLFSEIVVRGAAPDDDGPTVTALPIARVGSVTGTRPDGAPYGKVPIAPLKYTQHHYSSTAAAFKPKYVLDKECRDAKRCRDTARMIHGMHMKEAFWVTGSVDGFRAQTGAIWTPNTIAATFIESADLDERLWVMERTLEQTAGTKRTHFKLLPRGALSLGEEQS